MNPSVQQKLDTFFSQYECFKYKKGRIIISGDVMPKGVVYLKEGVVRNYSISAQGEKITLNIYKSPSFFPMSWVLNDSLNSSYYEAITDVAIYISPRKKFLSYIEKENSVLLDLLKRIYKGLDGYFQRMEYLMIGNAKARLISELVIIAKRFGEKEESKKSVKIKFTQQELSSQTGISRETISRELGKLAKKNLVAYKDSVLVIKDLENLEEELWSLN